MLPAPNQPLPLTASAPAPTVAAVNTIASQHHPIVRNLQITQCYYELSTAFVQRTGPVANWCTFATWASKQAGQTIRKQDLLRTLEALLKLEPEVEQTLSLVVTLAKQLGTRLGGEQIRQLALASLVKATAERAGDAVSRGNKKVFEEIALEFACFIATCFKDTIYTEAHIDDFCSQLQPGPPPEGQEYLRQAFRNYYQALFEEDAKKRAELQLLANLQVGFHEQTRLQPEIAESLNAVVIDPQDVKDTLMLLLFPKTTLQGWWRQVLQGFLQQTSVLERTIKTLVQQVQRHLRRILTIHLMTLTLPPDQRLRLGFDLTTTFPDCLKELANESLLTLLVQVDPTQNSVRQSGAIDWADLPERMHFIADLFRCYHEAKDLLQPPFTPDQAKAIKEGNVPGGRL